MTGYRAFPITEFRGSTLFEALPGDSHTPPETALIRACSRNPRLLPISVAADEIHLRPTLAPYLHFSAWGDVPPLHLVRPAGPVQGT